MMVIFKLAKGLYKAGTMYIHLPTHIATYILSTNTPVCENGQVLSHGLRPKEALTSFVKLLMPQELCCCWKNNFLERRTTYLYVFIVPSK